MNNDTYIQSAFETICANRQRPEGVWLSLYARVPFYGGPEEGGWWGNDTILEATQQFGFTDEAEAARVRVEQLAKDISEQARRDYGKQCNDEIEWCDARGIDHETFLREPDGPTRYFVVLEARRGSFEHQDDRHWE